MRRRCRLHELFESAAKKAERRIAFTVANAVAILLASGALAQGARPARDLWKTFRSSGGFSVAYPSRWYRVGNFKDRVMIRSSEGGAEGVVIRRGQAVITAAAVSAGAGGVDDAIASKTRRAKVIARRRIAPAKAAPGRYEIWEVIFQAAAVPPEDVPGKVPEEVATDFFVTDGSRVINVSLLNWVGDPLQEGYQRIARQMAESVRIHAAAAP